MSWTAPTTAMVTAEFTAQEINAIAAQQGTANLGGILSRVVAEVRGAIVAGGYAVDADTTLIPGGLHTAAIDVTRWRLLIAMPALKQLQTEERKAANDRAQAKLEKIAAQQWSPEPPASLSGATRTGNWNSENRLQPRAHPTPRPATPGADDYANDGATPAPVLTDLPTSDPHIAGSLWNNGGVVMVSAG